MNRARRVDLAKAERRKKLIARGKCPLCEMLLSSPYHTDCAFINSTKSLHVDK